jgi:hypothetical protein
MTASFLNRNLVIASVQTSGQTIPNYQNGDGVPTHRPNGGDLVAGDMWYDEEVDILSIYDGVSWNEVGGPGRTYDIYERLAAIETRLDSIEGN